MKVLHVIGSMNPLIGGPCQGIRNSIIESEKLGCYKEVVCLDASTEKFLQEDTFPIHALGPYRGPWCYSPKLIPWLVENLERFDTVIVNGLWLFSSYAVWRAIRLLRKRRDRNSIIPKVYIMPHGMLDPWFQQSKERQWKAFRNWIYWKVIENKVVNDADGILFTCETELLLARKPFRPYFPKREINVGYGIQQPPPPTEIMRDAFLAKCPEVRNQSYFLFLSRIHYKKGVDLLVEAYSTLLRNNIFDRASIPKLVIAGPGLDSPFGKEIQQLVMANPLLKDCIYFPRMLTGDAKWGALYNCEAFILPSHQENFGIAVVEALACGKSVLISDQVNIWNEISSNACGIVSEDSLDGTQKMLTKWMLLSSSERDKMEECARETFENKFHIRKAAARMLESIEF